MSNLTKRIVLTLLATAPLVSVSCVQSRQNLLGRWFNRANSVTFNADGTLIWNAPSGRATGQYTFQESVRRAKQDVPVKNLTVAMVRNGRRLDGEYEVYFMNGNRLRLTQTNSRQRIAPILVLKKAGEETEDPQASMPTN